MPIISTFFGIVIRMFYKEHEPPHFHAEHQGQQAKCNFDGEIVGGYITSRTARALIREVGGRSPSRTRDELGENESGTAFGSD